MDKHQLIRDGNIQVSREPEDALPDPFAPMSSVLMDTKQNPNPSSAGWKPTVMQPTALGPNIAHPDNYSVYINQPADETGGMDQSGTSDSFGGSFGNKTIRAAFIRKVYSILMVQLAVTVGIIALFIFEEHVNYYVKTSLPLYLSAYIIFLVTYITLTCCGKTIRRVYPWNFILLSIFTLSFAYLAGVVSAFNDTLIVILSLGISTVVCLAISLFAIQTKWDITGWTAYLCIFSFVVFIFGIFAIFFGIYFQSQIIQLVYAGLIAILFSLFLMYDTQNIIGGRKYELSSEEYIYGALRIYIDVMEIFMAILRLSGGRR